MTAVSTLGAVATLVSIAFGMCTFERWLRSRRPHELAWTQSLVMFALASAAYWSAGAVGWDPVNFRAFYLFGAILNVPYLALGTIYLLGGAELGAKVHRWLHLVAAFCAGVLTVASLKAKVPATGLPQGHDLFGIAPRIMAGVGSGVAATILIVGAVWSAISLVRLRRRPARGATPVVTPGRLALTNALIAAGSIVLSLGGTFFTGNQAEVGFGIFLVAGIVVLFAGFLVSTPSQAAIAAAAKAKAVAAAAEAETDDQRQVGDEPPTVVGPPEELDEFMAELWELAHSG